MVFAPFSGATYLGSVFRGFRRRPVPKAALPCALIRMSTVYGYLQVLARDLCGMLRNTHDIVAETRPLSPMGDEELWVMLAFGHDLHVAALVGGVWNDDFLHDFVGRGIGYNLSFASHL